MIPPSKRTPEQEAICNLLPLAAVYADQFRDRYHLDFLDARHAAILDNACSLVGEKSYADILNSPVHVSTDTENEDGA